MRCFLLIFLITCALITASCSRTEKTELLTPSETEWLKKNRDSIVFTPDPYFMPFEAFDKNSRFVGIGADFLSEIEKRLSVKFNIIRLEDWSSVISYLKNGKSSGVMAITDTAERRVFMDFTNPYIDVPVVILSREELKPFKALNRALVYKTGITKEYAYINPIMKKYPYLDYVTFNTDSEGIKQLAYGNIDLFIINIASASYYIKEYGLTNLKVSEETDFSFELSIGISRRMPELLSIMKKVLASIPENEKKRITDNWISFSQPWYRKYPGLFIFLIVDAIVLFVAMTAFTLVIIINKTLKKRVAVTTEELSKSEEFLKELLEIIPDPVFVKNSRHEYILVNRAFTELLCMKNESIIGKTEFDLFPENDAERFIRSDLTVLNKDIVLEYEDTHESSEGKTLYVLAKKTALTRYSGEKNIVTILHDITELREKEKELMQAQKLETIGRLSGGFAHDFNNILGGILGPIDLIEYTINSDRELPRSEILEYTAMARKSAERAKKIIQQLLSISRKNAKEFEIIEVRKAVHNIIDIASHSFDKQVEIKIITKNTPSYIKGDYSMLEQALLNVFINSYHSMTIMRKDSECWGGTITVEISEKAFTQTDYSGSAAILPGHYCCIRISDTGVGMDSKTKEMIFEPFFSTKGAKGSGLGLTMVINIVNNLQGSITIDSVPEKGTDFSLYFPSIEGEIKHPEKRKENIIRGSGNIVVIDDEESIRKTASNMLELCGYSTETFSNGHDAVEYIQKGENNPALIILDLIMPGLSAENTFSSIRKINPEIPFLLTSGFSNDERINLLMSKGIENFIPKPFSTEELSKEVARILSLKKNNL